MGKKVTNAKENNQAEADPGGAYAEDPETLIQAYWDRLYPGARTTEAGENGN